MMTTVTMVMMVVILLIVMFTLTDVHYSIMMVRRCRIADSPIKDLKISVMVIMMIMLSFLYKSKVLALSINIHSPVSNDGVGFYRSAA